MVVAGDAVYNGVHQFLGESTDGGRDRWRQAIGAVAALRPHRAVAGHKDKELDDDAGRVIHETRDYLDAVDELLPKCSTAVDFFNAMVARYPNRYLGRATLWAGARVLYADVENALGGWL